MPLLTFYMEPPSPSTPTPACPLDWEFNEDDGKCYKLFEDRVDFQGAVAACGSRAAQLAAPNTEQLDTYLYDNFV